MLAARREFLKMTALTAIGTQLLPGCSVSNAEAGAAVPAAAPRSVSIIGAIDIAQALADNSLDNNLYWFDNNSAAGSLYQGTGHLLTSLGKGDSVQWFISGLQVETVADIASISGPGATIANALATTLAPGFSFWSGKISDLASGSYPYSIVLKVENRLMTASSLTLAVQ